LVVAGGSCALNPEPMADFIDLFVIGGDEGIVLELLEVFRAYRGNKGELLRQATRLDDMYVPSFSQIGIFHNKGGKPFGRFGISYCKSNLKLHASM